MVGMFDMGLSTATKSSNYDKARAFANERLEQTKARSYENVRTVFPNAAPCTPASGTGNCTTSTSVPSSAGLPTGSTYTVTKQYVQVPTGASVSLANSVTDSKMIRLTITVNWGSGNSINVSGVVSGGLT